jgi:hypothetical protein
MLVTGLMNLVGLFYLRHGTRERRLSTTIYSVPRFNHGLEATSSTSLYVQSPSERWDGDCAVELGRAHSLRINVVQVHIVNARGSGSPDRYRARRMGYESHLELVPTD